MLPNLHDIAVKAQQRYRDDFTAHTAAVITADSLKMYIPKGFFSNDTRNLLKLSKVVRLACIRLIL